MIFLKLHLIGADRVAAIQQCFTYAETAVQRSTSFEEDLLEVSIFFFFFFCPR